MAVAEFTTPLDLEKIRADFPILARPVHGKRLVYLDSAASSQKPRQVIDTLVDVYETSYANVHRGVYHLGAVATERYEHARDIIAGFVNAPTRREVIFVRKTPPRASTWSPTATAASSSARATPSSPPRWSTTPTSCPGSCWPADRRHPALPAPDRRRRASTRSRWPQLDDGREHQAGRRHARLQLVRHHQRPAGAGRVGARPRRRAGGRRRPGRAPPAGRRAGAGLSTSTPSPATRCAAPAAGALWGRGRAAGADADPFLTGGEPDPPGASWSARHWNELPWKFEAGHARPRRGDRLRRRRRVPAGDRARPDRAARARADRLRLRRAGRASTASASTGRRPSAGRHLSLQRRATCTRTTSPRCSTREGIACAPATTARSR